MKNVFLQNKSMRLCTAFNWFGTEFFTGFCERGSGPSAFINFLSISATTGFPRWTLHRGAS
jgi:hypothetical protein